MLSLWQKYCGLSSLCCSSTPPSSCPTPEECPHTGEVSLGLPELSTVASCTGTLRAPCPPPHPSPSPQKKQSQIKCWVISLDLGPGTHIGPGSGALAPWVVLPDGATVPLVTGTSSTSFWMPPWAWCSSTWACVPSASWWSGSSGSPCVSANMVMYTAWGRGGGF